MPNMESAIKRVRQTAVKEGRNKPRINEARSAIKKFETAVENNEGNVQELYNESISLIDKANSKGLIHQNKANRLKSKLSNKLSNN